MGMHKFTFTFLSWCMYGSYKKERIIYLYIVKTEGSHDQKSPGRKRNCGIERKDP